MTELKLEIRDQQDGTVHSGPMMFTPPVSEGYWTYRVQLSDKQAIVGFPKFLTIGIGFAAEEDWNTNFPSTCGAQEIYDHIAHNKSDEAISDEDCLTAIRMIQDAVAAERGRR